MGELAKEIEMESTQLSEVPNAAKASLPNVSPAQKASVFCFKKRKKSCEKVMEEEEDQESDSLALKRANQHTNTACNEAEVSNPSWRSGGAWLAFKRLVTSRRRSKSALKKQPQFSSRVRLEMNVEESGLPHFPKEQTSSSLKIPCLRFSRSRKKPSQSDSPEELDHGDKVDETTSVLDNKANSEPENVAEEGSLSTKHPSRDPEEKEGDIGVAKNIGNVFVSPGENIFVVEMRADPDQYTDCVVQSEIIHSEAVLETEQEKQIFQLHHGSLYGNPEDAENKREDFQFEIGPLILQDLSGNEHSVFGEEEADSTYTKAAELENVGGVADVMEASNGTSEVGSSVEVMLHCSPSAIEGEASGMPDSAEEEAKPEENKCALPGVGIVITITEAEEFQEEEEPSHMCEPFSFPQASKKKGNKKSSGGQDSGAGGHGRKRESKPCSQVPSPFSANDQEHRTAEQYEMLLIETAASLVKAAIQSSIEQLVSEVALEQNKQNSFL